MTAAPAEDRERVGPYRVIQAIGAGGTARIDLARIDRAYGFQRHVVLKRPLEHLRSDAGVAASLQREARIGGRLRHPNLVAILDAGIHDGYDYLVLEYVHGAALRSVMHADAPGQVKELPLAVALSIVSDAARGMHEAHELTGDDGAPLGLVHRDVSPGNVLIGMDGTVKLADFGIAKETRVATLSGSMHGTVTYMAPEQCRGHAYDHRADVFSLGVILYELVTGTRLFWADNDVASLHRVLSGTVPRPRKLKPQLAAALEDIVLTAVAHDAARRFPTALALAMALEAYAARAGEVLGARWIARTMARVVGAKPVPWIAAPTQVEAPASDGSLVELIAAAGADEPVEPTFGDADDGAAELEAPRAAPPQPNRRVLAGLVALGLVAAAGVAVIVTRGSPAPSAPPTPAATAPLPAAAPSPTTSVTPTTTAPPPTTTAPPPTTTAPPPTITAPPPTTPPSSPEASTARPDRAPLPTLKHPSAAAVRPKRRPAVAKRHADDAKLILPLAEHRLPKTDGRTPPTEGRTPSAESRNPPAETRQPPATPPPPPPANVEWKPTLLLPTDGSAAKAPR